MTELQAGAELKLRVAEKVIGWTRSTRISKVELALCRADGTNPRPVEEWWQRPGEPADGQFAVHESDVPDYPTDPAADYEVLVHVREHWPNEKPDGWWEKFCEHLWELQCEHKKHGWNPIFDSHGLYRPGDYSRAALVALWSKEVQDE